MNGPEGNHLSPETIEDLVLGRLPEEQMAGVLEHLRKCELCSKALEQERILASGTKAWARAAMKKRLAERIQAASRHQVPWPHVLGAAALIVAIVGIGVLYNWRRSPEKQEATIAETRKADTTENVAATPAPAPQRDLRSGVPTAEDRLSAATERDRDAAQKTKGSANAPQASDQSVPQAEKKDEESHERPVLIAAAEQTAPKPSQGGAIAVTGTIMNETVPSLSQSEISGASKQGLSTGRMEARKRVLSSHRENPLTYIITQQLKSPGGNDSRGGAGEQIPALITRTGDTVHITLLLDSLLSQEQLEMAYVRKVAADSIHVVLPYWSVGYHLPIEVTR